MDNVTRQRQLPTEYGDNHSVFEYLERTITDKVDAVDGICLVYNILARRTEHWFDLHCDRLEATLWRLSEYRQRQYLTMQMHCYVALHLDREIFEHLQASHSVNSLWHTLTATAHFARSFVVITAEHLTFSNEISELSKSRYCRIRECAVSVFVLTLTSKQPIPLYLYCSLQSRLRAHSKLPNFQTIQRKQI